MDVLLKGIALTLDKPECLLTAMNVLIYILKEGWWLSSYVLFFFIFIFININSRIPLLFLSAFFFSFFVLNPENEFVYSLSILQSKIKSFRWIVAVYYLSYLYMSKNSIFNSDLIFFSVLFRC